MYIHVWIVLAPTLYRQDFLALRRLVVNLLAPMYSFPIKLDELGIEKIANMTCYGTINCFSNIQKR